MSTRSNSILFITILLGLLFLTTTYAAPEYSFATSTFVKESTYLHVRIEDVAIEKDDGSEFEFNAMFTGFVADPSRFQYHLISKQPGHSESSTINADLRVEGDNRLALTKFKGSFADWTADEKANAHRTVAFDIDIKKDTYIEDQIYLTLTMTSIKSKKSYFYTSSIIKPSPSLSKGMSFELSKTNNKAMKEFKITLDATKVELTKDTPSLVITRQIYDGDSPIYLFVDRNAPPQVNSDSQDDPEPIKEFKCKLNDYEFKSTVLKNLILTIDLKSNNDFKIEKEKNVIITCTDLVFYSQAGQFDQQSYSINAQLGLEDNAFTATSYILNKDRSKGGFKWLKYGIWALIGAGALIVIIVTTIFICKKCCRKKDEDNYFLTQ